MKASRFFAAILIAFGSLFFVTPAHAQTLEEAQAALAAGQQELVDATLDKHDADALEASASQDVRDAQAAYDTAHAAKLATAVLHPATTTVGPAQNVVVNGEFNDASAWSGVALYQDSMYNNSSVAVVRAGALWGSYSAGNFYYQQGNFASPVRSVTFSVDVWDNNNQRNNTQYDYYRIEFRTYSASGARLNYYNLEYSGAWHDWVTKTATYNLSADAVRWDVGFRLQDGGYWNGNYGPGIDNVKVLAATSVTTPEYTTYGEAETAAETAARTALDAAQAAYTTALATKNAAQARYDAAVLALPALEAAVVALTPPPAPEPTPAPVAPWWAAQYSEGERVTLTAPDGWEFYSVRSWYGSPTDDNCGADTSSALGQAMIGQHSVELVLDNALQGDPCGGVVKVTRLTWSVVLSTPAPSPTATPQEPLPVEPVVVPTETPTPVETTTPEPTPTPAVTETPTPLPTVTASPEPTVTPTPTPDPTPVVEPTPTPTNTGTTTPTEPTSSYPTNMDTTPSVPTVDPTPAPVPPAPPAPVDLPVPAPEPSTPAPEPTPSEPAPTPSETPSTTPSEAPSVEPTPETTPTPTPTKTEEPVVVPTPTVSPTQEPAPTPSETSEPAPVPSETVPPTTGDAEPSSTTEAVAAIAALAAVDPQDLSPKQVEQLVSAANQVLESTPEGSPAYEKALDALAVAAQADDPEVPALLADIPGVGEAAVAVLGAFNAMGNLGADMSPAHRETAKKEVVAAIVLTQVTTAAIGAATSAATSTASSSGSAARRREG